MIMKLQMIKITFCYLALITISVARGQTKSPFSSDGYLMLYRLDRAPGKYVLCMSSESPEKGKTSTVVVGDTFTIQPSNGVCIVIMSNAYFLQTTIGRSSSNQVAQIKFQTDAWKWYFPKNTKLVFNDSVAELAKAKLEAPSEANAKTDEGDEALRQLKKMGLEPPEDMDMKKAVGHK
jgi:hypothetical protein